MRRVVLGLLALLVAPQLPVAEAMPPMERHLVSFHGLPPEDGARVLSARVVESFPFARVALLEGPADAFDALRAMPDVAGVYPDEPLTPSMERVRALVHAQPAAGDASWPTGRNVTVALVDSGLDADHPAFAGRVAASVRIPRSGGPSGGDGDQDGHGTHVAGIVAGDGAGSENRRMRGLAPAARLVAVDISDAFTTSSAVRAFAWIHENRHAHDIRVVSNSWGREKEGAHYDPDDPVIRASDALVADGLVVVFSAGNRGREGAETLTTEATNPNVLTVGAANAAGRPEPYSSRGPARDGDGQILEWVKPDVVAPGTGILSTRSGHVAPANARSDEERLYVAMNGTSMAAPQVAAAAALLLDRHPHLTPGMVAAILARTARDLGTPGADAQTGHGMLDVAGALQLAAALESGDQAIVVERVVPVRREGAATAAEGLVLLAQGTAQLPPTRAVAFPLAFPPGAVEAHLWFNWSGPGAFDVVLLGPEGETPFLAAGDGRLHLRADVPEGIHRVEARPTGAATSATFTLEGGVLVRETRLGERAFELHARPAPYAPGAFTLSQSASERILGVLEAAPLLALALCAGVASAAGVWLLRRRKA